MAQDTPDEQSLYHFLVDDSSEQIIAGTPVSPQFNPDGLEPGRHRAAHGTGSGDQPMVPRPAPPRQIPRINPAARQPIAPDNTGPHGGQPVNFAGPLPLHQQPQTLAQSPLMPSFPTASSYGQTNFMPSPMVDWPAAGQASLASGTDTLAPPPSSNLFDYNAQSEFISPTSIVNNFNNGPFGYGISWPGPGATSTLTNAALQSLMTAGPNLWHDDDDFDDDGSSAIPKDADADGTSGSTSKWQKNEKGVVAVTAASPSATTNSQNSHASLRCKASTLNSTASGSTTSSRLSKLRSASRTTKNTHHKPAETAEERRTRASHNLVEKQYRNRLNDQFEALLNALPEQVRSGGEGEDSEPTLDFTDKRVSKAEVLDMARRHIRALERERDALEHERDELLSSMEKLRAKHGRRGGGGDGGGGGGGGGEGGEGGDDDDEYDMAGAAAAP